MSEEEYRQREEKEEKDEKDDRDEKSWDEKWRRDPLSAATWAFILIWAGVVLLAANIGFFDDSFFDAWPLFFTGAGVILLLEVAVRLVVPAYRQPVTVTIILAFVFLAIGLGALINWAIVWAVALIGVGAYVLLRGIGQRRE